LPLLVLGRRAGRRAVRRPPPRFVERLRRLRDMQQYRDELAGDDEAADVIFEGGSKKETLDILYHSQARKDCGVRLLYQKGTTLPEHSHLDLQQSGDITE
jgi:hypothetical protein